MTSSRAKACAWSSEGPLTAIHANFICGSPQIFERPLNVKVSALFKETKLWAGELLSEKSRKTSSATNAIPRCTQKSASFDCSAVDAYWPVGLLGWTTIRAFVRDDAAASAAKSICQP